jgi:type III secretion regulatory protein HpaA
MSSSSFNTNRQHQQLLQKQTLQRHHNQEVAHAREAAHEAQQERAEATYEQAQGRYGDTVFRTVPLPPAPPPRQNRTAAHRGEVRPARADGKEEEREDPTIPEAAERRESPGKEPVEATDKDGEGHKQHHGGGDSHGGSDQAGSFGGGGQSGSQSGGHSGGSHSGGHSSGGQSGGQGSGQQRGQSHHDNSARFGSPAGRSTALPSSLAAGQATQLQAFRSELAEIALPERRARYLAEAMVALSKPGRAQLNNDAMMMSLMAAYIESAHEPGALSTLARVKQVLLEMGPTLTGALPPGPRERNRLALLPLKLLVCDRQRTEAQRQVAVERLRAAQRWPADTIET